MTGEMVLETERLLIRRLTLADVDELVTLDSDPAVVDYITGGEPEFTVEMLRHWLSEYERWPCYGTFAAIERFSGRFLGWFHLRPDNDDAEPELGYRLRREAWGLGYATEGSRALIELAFASLGARRVWATAMAANVGSLRVMTKSGMRFVRTFHADWPYRIPGDELGDVEYAITRTEWEADQARAAPAPRQAGDTAE